MPSLPSSQGLLLAELTQHLHRFFHHMDERRYDDAAAMFAEDGRWLRQGEWLHGPAAVRAALQARPAGRRTRHVLSNAHVASADAQGVLVEAYMTAYRHDDAPAAGAVRIAGALRLNLVSTLFRQVQGEWRIAEQRLVPEFEFDDA